MAKIRNFFYRDKPLINRMFRNLLVVMVLAAFLTSLTSAINTAFIASFFDKDGIGVAAVSLAITSLGFVDIIMAILTTGTQAKTAGAMANVDKRSANEFVTCGMVLAFIAGVIFFFVGYFGADGIALSLAANKSVEIQQATAFYLRGLAIAMPFYILNSVLRSISILDGDRTLVFTSLVSIIVFTIVGNFINAYVVKGGIFGCTLSTSLSYIISTLILLTHFFRKKAMLEFHIKLFNRGTSYILIKRGMVNATKALATWVYQLFTNYVLLQVGGPSALTILGIQGSCFSIVNSLVNGFYDCGFILNHVISAEEDNKAVYDLCTLLYKFVFYFVLPISIIFVIFARQLALAYEPTPEQVESLTIAIICSIITVPFIAVQTIAIVFMPVKNCHIAFILRILVFPVIFASIFAFTMGEKGFWIGNAIGVCFYYPFHLAWASIKCGHFPRNMIEMYFLNDNFGYQDKYTLRKRIVNHEDGVSLIKEVDEFADKLNLKIEVKNNLIKCLSNIVKLYDLTKIKNEKEHYAEVLVYYKEGHMFIRLRDNSDFDLKETDSKYLSDPVYQEINKNINESIKKVSYINVLNVTNYLITI